MAQAFEANEEEEQGGDGKRNDVVIGAYVLKRRYV